MMLFRLPLCLLATAGLLAAEAAGISAADLSGRSPLIASLDPADGTWTEVPTPTVDAKPAKEAIASAGKAFLAALKAAKNAPSVEAQRAIATLVGILGSATQPNRPDALDPVFARRTVRGGALRGLGADATALEKAVAEACTLRPVTVFTGPNGERIEERRDVFGIGGWFSAGSRQAYAIPHPTPQFLPAPELVLVVELPAKAPADAGAGQAVAASLLRGQTEVARWQAKDGKVSADPAVWRKAVPKPSGRALADGLLPPHLVLCDPSGDPVALATAHGTLQVPRTFKPAETAPFLEQTARLLPDAAHLDLFGQYIFQYVFDSPDPRFPLITGNKDVKGEIHQTAEQLLIAATAGQCRGDCDDLAELYQALAERQGRTGHLLVLPSHTAFTTARKDGDEWVVEVMQTGPTYAFRHKDVREALRATFAHFDPAAPFSPDHLGLLLRFSGENTRGHFGLGYRIFTEPDYARTMIDVQRDWQYQTYARAIAKMVKLIEGGDNDPSNIHELAALYKTIGQWADAVTWYRKNLAATSDPVAQISVRLELAAVLRRDGKADEAKTVLREAAEAVGANREKLGNGVGPLGMRMATALLAAGDQQGGRDMLMQTALGPMANAIMQLSAMAQQKKLSAADWGGDGRFAAIRQLTHQFVNCVSLLLEKAGPDAATDRSLVNVRQILDLWLCSLAFLDAATPSESIRIYATAARIHALDIGDAEVTKAVTAAKPPDRKAKRKHTDRPLGPAAQAREGDLPWIRISPHWWQAEVTRALRGSDDDDPESSAGAVLDPAKADRRRAAEAAAGAVAAHAACKAMGLTGQDLDWALHMTVLTSAIANADDKMLRERLREVKRQDDKRLRDATAMTMGSLAPLCDDKQWQAVLKAWADEVDYKPKWFAIAWTANIAGAPKHALATARMAAARFKDEPAFREEVAFMEKLLKGK